MASEDRSNAQGWSGTPEASAETQPEVHQPPEAVGPRASAEPATAPPANTSTKSTASKPTDHADTLDHAPSSGPEVEHEEKPGAAVPSGGKRALGGRAVIDQREAIPTTGRRIPTSKWEYYTFCIFCQCIFFEPLVGKSYTDIIM